MITTDLPLVRASLARLSLLAAVALAGCSAPYEHTLVAAAVLSPDPVLHDETVKWAARWAAATGKNITVGEGGIPIRAVDTVTIIGDSGKAECGATLHEFLQDTGEFVRALEIQIDIWPARSCGLWRDVLGHEIGHAIGAMQHPEDVGAEAGIMSMWLDRRIEYAITEASLVVVCTSTPCPAFVPEETVLP